MPPKRANLIPAVPPPGEDDARREWAIKYRSSFTTRWGVQGGFVNKVVPVRWAVSNQDLYQQQSETIWGVALREFINLELQIDNARPSNLLGRNGSWVKEYRKQMEEEGPKASGVRLGEADYKEALGEWIDALDSIAALKATAQASADLDRALVRNQEQMQTDQLMMRMNEKARRQEQAQANYTAIVEGHEQSQGQIIDTISSESSTDSPPSVLDPTEEENIRHLQTVTSSTRSSSTKRVRPTSGLLTSRSSSVKKGKMRTEEGDTVVQSATVLADAMKDGMEMLVQGLSGARKAPADDETAERLDRVEKAQLEIQQSQKVADEVAKERHEQLIALFQAQITK